MYNTATSNTYWWAPVRPLRLVQEPVFSLAARARINLALVREVSLDTPARLRPQASVGVAVRRRASSSGRPGYRRRRVGGVVR